jgi:hypothetical protein
MVWLGWGFEWGVFQQVLFMTMNDQQLSCTPSAALTLMCRRKLCY